MVCFGRFFYKISLREIDNFVLNATRYFPDVKWAVSCGDMTINTTDINYAITKLKPLETDTIEFDTGMIWDSLSFWQALPRMHPCEVSQELRLKLSPQVKDIALRHKFEKQEFDWTTVPQFMTLLHEISPIVSYFALPSCNMIIYEESTKHPEPHLTCIFVEDGRVSYAPRIIFDLDDGFATAYGDDEVPRELSDAFQVWVKNGRVGPVLV